MMKKILNQWFLIALFLTPLIAYLFPQIGASGGILHADILTKISMALIFFFSGLSFSRQEFISAFKNYKLAIVIQFLCFVAIPLIMFALSHSLFPWSGLNPSFTLGTLILASVPMTTTSCVIFTAMARGDTVASLFNATLSNFIGVFSAPITIGLFLGLKADSFTFDPIPVIINLFSLIILPILAGQLINFLMSRWFPVNTEVFFAKLSKGLLLFMIYAAFCDSFIAFRQQQTPWMQLGLLTLWMAIVYWLFILLAYFTGKNLDISEAQRRTLFFTAPQKTIVVGLPLNMALIQHAHFSSEIVAAFLLMPLLIYNMVQWVSSVWLVKWLNEE